jgi:hypothetical protein
MLPLGGLHGFHIIEEQLEVGLYGSEFSAEMGEVTVVDLVRLYSGLLLIW